MQNDGTCKSIHLAWEVSKSTGALTSDLGFVAVTDGKKVRMTPFRQTVVPPPMSAFELHVPEEAKQVHGSVMP